MLDKSHFLIIVFTLMLNGCFGVDLSESTDGSSGSNGADSSASEEQLDATMIQGAALSLSNTFQFVVKNPDDKYLENYQIILSAGLDQTVFAKMPATSALNNPLTISTPSFIVGSRVYVTMLEEGNDYAEVHPHIIDDDNMVIYVVKE